MMIENPIRIVRELKGAPISIVLVLGFAGQRVTQKWLERATGYTDKPVSQALAYLQEIGLVDHTQAGWQLTAAARQLPLGLALDEGDGETEAAASIRDECGSLDECGGQGDVSRNISDSVIIITTSESIITEGGSNNNNNEPPGRNFSDSDISPPELIEQNLAALGAARVIGGKRQTLARLKHVTPAYVRAWEAQLKMELGERYKPGILINTIEDGAPAPPVRENGHVLTCGCDECRRLAYRSWVMDEEDDEGE